MKAAAIDADALRAENIPPQIDHYSRSSRFSARVASPSAFMRWLSRIGVEHDVSTDHRLTLEGLTELDGYDVVLTGSHPEYVTGSILDALETFVEHGGGLMYLGGNGYYWVTSIDPYRPHVIEVRRGSAGTRPWRSLPGEERHLTTGELGGLWRDHGRPPNSLIGIGFAGQGWGPSRARIDERR